MASPPAHAADWNALFRAAHGGAPGALDELLEQHRPLLNQVAGHELNPAFRAKAGASDLVQQTMLDAHRHFAEFRGQSPPELRAWLLVILRRRLADLARHFLCPANDVRREVPAEAVTGQSGESAPLVGDSTSPSGKVVHHEEAEAVRAAVTRLPDHYREVIALRHQEDLPWEEVGRRLGRTPDAARMLWSRAVEALRELLGPRP
jgi:RNA polymerase sigma-70 factor (ECF subfamily)